MERVGKDSVITVEEPKAPTMRWVEACSSCGYLAYFVTDAETMEAVLENPI